MSSPQEGIIALTNPQVRVKSLAHIGVPTVAEGHVPEAKRIWKPNIADSIFALLLLEVNDTMAVQGDGTAILAILVAIRSGQCFW